MMQVAHPSKRFSIACRQMIGPGSSERSKCYRSFGLQLSLPYVKHLENKLWELRVQAGRKAYRVIYFAWTGQRFILLHAFLKKSAKTPRQELAIAESRLADFLLREGKP